MSFICPPELLTLAHELANAARPIALHYFRSAGLGIEMKSDHTPVTLADTEVEKALRVLLGKKRPQDGIFGEEEGRSNPDAEWTWILDPIDGTATFSAGLPSFGTLIALSHRDHGFVLGLCDMPTTQDRWWSVGNGPVYMNGKEMPPRGAVTLEQAVFACTNPLRLPAPVLGVVQSIREKARLTVLGGNFLNYALLASGFVDLIIETRQQIYDVAPFVPMIQNGGGKITTSDGAAIGFQNGNDMIVAASTPELHAHLITLIKDAT